ncbi:MAG: hypothetical protein FJX60_05175 [Alphaproteobacteria bacterium]|nr:hypothetical protein [Alphaproteobacteria bacterium]
MRQLPARTVGGKTRRRNLTQRRSWKIENPQASPTQSKTSGRSPSGHSTVPMISALTMLAIALIGVVSASTASWSRRNASG